MNAIEHFVDQDTHEQQLNDNYDEVSALGATIGAGTFLKLVDPVAFAVSCSDEDPWYECSECQDTFDDKEEAESCCNEC